MKNYLNFEADIEILEGELNKLKDPYNQSGLSEVDTNKISKTQKELDKKLGEIYSNYTNLSYLFFVNNLHLFFWNPNNKRSRKK